MSCEKTCDLPKNLIKGFRLPLFPQKSIIFASMNQASGFIFSPTGDATDAFTEISVYSSCGFNVMLRAKRFGRWWMLKALKADVCTNPTYQQLLQKEYDILTRLQHSNIVRVESLEEVPGFGRCIVMEWIEGETLDKWLEQKHTRAERRLAARQLLTAVEYIHERQIVHRDLKPSNIMIASNGGTLKVIDFGLSDADNYAILKTPAGTDGYISVEQRHDSKPDVRNDIYSLGIILREMRLGISYRMATQRCLCPLALRYPNVHALRIRILSLHRHLTVLPCLLVLFTVGAIGGIVYNKVVAPKVMYDVVTQFTIGNLEYKSWGGGLVTVCAANEKDSVIEIPATVNYQGMTYRVDELEDSAFADYPQLKRVVLPDNPQLHMMKHIFDGSPGLESLCFRSKEPPKLGNAIWTVTMEDVFDASALKRIRLYVPMGSREAYHRSPWGKFAQIEEYR